ncbi:MAG: hypothetical protein K8I00_08240 [Candidatus Omnitrophica bacterium]|nr:hypothetical protein [Candidatus Omnitrophota bacterium]
MLRSITGHPRGITIFALLLIAGSLYKLSGFINYDYYVFMFQQLPTGQVNDRYILSLATRGVGLITAGGLLARREWARQLFLCLCVFTLITLYWKHPYRVFENIAIYQEWLQGLNDFPAGTNVTFAFPLYPESLQGYGLKNPLIPRLSWIVHSLIDLVFCASAVCYFTRARVVEMFQEKS